MYNNCNCHHKHQNDCHCNCHHKHQNDCHCNCHHNHQNDCHCKHHNNCNCQDKCNLVEIYLFLGEYVFDLLKELELPCGHAGLMESLCSLMDCKKLPCGHPTLDELLLMALKKDEECNFHKHCNCHKTCNCHKKW